MLKGRGNSMQGAAQRLRELRLQLHYSPREMAEKMGVQTSAYYRNENGESLPNVLSLQRLQKEFGISMDWLLFNSAPKYLEEKQPENAEKKETAGFEALMPEVRELLEHMQQDPVFRHRVLLNFYEYKNKTKQEDIDRK